MDSLKRLWTHEVMRVYYDRLVDDADRKWLVEALDKCLSQEFKTDFNELFKHLDFNNDGNIHVHVLCTCTVHDDYTMYMYIYCYMCLYM